jgi:hypothetical protein
MATGFPSSAEPGFTALVREIVNDIGDLVKHEIKFARAEIKADLRKSREALVLLALGAGSAFLGVLLLALTVVYLLHWLTAPAGADPSSVPLWGCFGIVTVVFLGAGAGLLVAGKKMVDSFTPLPVQTVQTVKENVEWITSSK